MANVILHIGAHKTATTYLQATFHRNRDLLARHGLIYPDLGVNDAHHPLAGLWQDNLGVDLPKSGPGSPAAMWDRIVEDHAGGEDTVFLSGENFSRCHPQPVDFAEVAARLAPFAQVRVVYTVRRQVELVPSLWVQVAKTRRPPSIAPYIEKVLAERRGGGVPVDHCWVHERVRLGFPAEAITILNYPDFKRQAGGVVQVFLDLAGIALRHDQLAPPPEDRANVSPSPLAVWVAAQLQPGGPPAPRLVERVAQLLGGPLGNRPTTLLTRKEYARIDSRGRAYNARLEELVAPVQPGFAIPERDPAHDLLYRDEIPPALWEGLRDLGARSAADRILAPLKAGLARLRSQE